MKKSPANGTNLSPEELQAALLDVQDALERAQIKFILLGDVAYSIYSYEELKGDKVVVGVLRNQWMPECVTILRAWRPQVEEDKHGVHYKVGNVPIQIRVIRKNFFFLKDPDLRAYYDCSLFLPNPFARYWHSRSFV